MNWHDGKSIAEIVYEYGAVRGDLSEQYARDQLVSIIEGRVAELFAPLVEQARQEGAREALRRFADSRGVNVGDEDDDYWRGYRQAQRECLHDASALAERAATPGSWRRCDEQP